jgi:hypothetical protein
LYGFICCADSLAEAELVPLRFTRSRLRRAAAEGVTSFQVQALDAGLPFRCCAGSLTEVELVPLRFTCSRLRRAAAEGVTSFQVQALDAGLPFRCCTSVSLREKKRDLHKDEDLVVPP